MKAVSPPGTPPRRPAGIAAGGEKWSVPFGKPLETMGRKATELRRCAQSAWHYVRRAATANRRKRRDAKLCGTKAQHCAKSARPPEPLHPQCKERNYFL